MEFELGESKVPKVQVIPVFLWGLLITPHPNPKWPIDDMEDQFPNFELEVMI